MKKYIKPVVLFVLLVGPVLLSFFYFGVFLFNNPSREQYPVQGIDISHHQGEIDWVQVAEDGVDFVYMKATEGGDFVDKRFSGNWQGARENGVVAGGYHFFTLCRPGDEQADNFISILPVMKGSLPPAIDLEFMGNCSSRPEPLDFYAELKTFYEIIKSHYGVEPVIYTTYEFMEKYDLNPYLSRLWIRDVFFQPGSDLGWRFWQYTNRLHVGGIPGYVDGNVFNGTSDELRQILLP